MATAATQLARKRFFARKHMAAAATRLPGAESHYRGECFRWDMDHPGATLTERDRAHRAIARKWKV